MILSLRRWPLPLLILCAALSPALFVLPALAAAADAGPDTPFWSGLLL